MQLHYGKSEVKYFLDSENYRENYNEHFIYVKNKFISEDVADILSKKLEVLEDSLEKGRVISYTAKESAESNLRDSSISWVKEDDFFNKLKTENEEILQKFTKVNDDIFQLDIDSLMRLQYTTYSVGEHFNWHPDGPFSIHNLSGKEIPQNLKHRKLSMSICLSRKEDYDGGEFCIVLPNRDIANIGEMYKMDYGDAIIFPAFCSHKVNAVTRGMRKSLVYWFCGPRWR
jgi:PKHD-type hydroxylase